MHTCHLSHAWPWNKTECVLSQSPAVVRLASGGGRSPSTWDLVVFPSLPLLCHLIFTHIYHFQLNQQKAAGKCWGEGTIIHVAQPLMQICLLMKAFWAKRIYLMPILYMPATWPWCPVASSFSSSVSVIFMIWSKDNKLSRWTLIPCP